MLTGILVMISIFYFHQVKRGIISIGCDGDSEVNRANKLRKSNPVNCFTTDIRKSITSIKKRLTTDFRVTIEWIYMDVHKDNRLG